MAKTPRKFESTFETYKRGGQIGIGGTGSVFECTDSAKRELALKLLRPEHVNRGRLKRFQNEIAFCSRDQGPSILLVLDHGAIDVDGVKCPFYVMERFPGTLRNLFEEGLDHGRVMELVDDILLGLEVAHERGTWHRDLKPENILVSADGHAVIADFGIAHFARDQIEATVETKVTDRLANWRYAAPEQRVGGVTIDHRADLYALGLVLAEAFTGEVIQGAGYTPVSDVAPDYAFLDPIIDRLVQQDPANRFDDIRSLRTEISAHQRLADAAAATKRLTAIPLTPPETVEAPEEIRFAEVIDFDPSRGVVSVRLNREPPRGWFDWFGNPAGHTYTHNCEPPHVRMAGADVMLFPARDRNVQHNIDLAKAWLPLATADYHQRQRAMANQKSRAEEERRTEELRRARQREHVLGSFKI